jgi:hypothetical protein
MLRTGTDLAKGILEGTKNLITGNELGTFIQAYPPALLTNGGSSEPPFPFVQANASAIRGWTLLLSTNGNLNPGSPGDFPRLNARGRLV